MSKPFSGKLIITIALLFACSAIPAFANRGGGGGGGFHGGGGGGFHGGGSFRGGGGFSGGSAARGGGGFRGGRSFSAPPAGYGASRSYAPSARSGGGFASRPGSSSSRPNGNFAGGNQRFGNSPSARPGVADGQWHSFGGSTETHGAVGAPSQGGASNGGGLHVLNGNRGASTGAVRSFSGQRGEIFENAPAARNVVPRGQSLSTMHNSFGASLAGNSGFRSSSAFLGSSRFGNGSSFLGNRGFAGGVNTIPLRGGFNRFGFNNGFGFNRFGCWNCGFGFGGLGLGFGWGGWGLGWPGWGFGWWNPFWVDPWWGWSAPAYYGYPPYGYVYPDSENNPPPDYHSNPPAQDSGEGEYDQDNQGSLNSGSTNGNWGTPNGPSPALAPSNGALAVPVLIYLRNGSVLTVRDYWMIDGQLHYILMSGAQRAVNLEGVDLPRTNTENAKSGVKFIFKSEPSVTSPEPNGNGAPVQPNAQPGGPNTAAPTQQINAVPQPEART